MAGINNNYQWFLQRLKIIKNTKKDSNIQIKNEEVTLNIIEKRIKYFRRWMRITWECNEIRLKKN